MESITKQIKQSNSLSELDEIDKTHFSNRDRLGFSTVSIHMVSL